jgi:serine/threonine protein phosphatase PrpC
VLSAPGANNQPPAAPTQPDQARVSRPLPSPPAPPAISQGSRAAPAQHAAAVPPKAKKRSLLERLSHGIDRLDEQVDNLWQNMTGRKEETPPQQPVQTPASSSPPRVSPKARTTRLSNLPAPKMAGEMIGGTYRILQTYALHRSNYYRVLSMQCENGHLNTPAAGETCSQCHTRLPEYLAHETVPLVPGNGSRQALLALSRGDNNTSVPGMLTHYHIFDYQERQYVISYLPPATRQVLPAVREIPTSPEAATFWTSELAKAIIHLHKRGFLFATEDNSPDFLEPVVILDGQLACLADLTTCTPLLQQTRGCYQHDLLFLARLLYTAATGDRQHILRPSPKMETAPPAIRRVINRVRSSDYPDVQAFLSDLLSTPPTEAPRSLHQNYGKRTDVGRQRDHNEDYIGYYSFSLMQSADAPEVGLYIVADGMGGHQAGELASMDVVKAVVQHIQDNLHVLQSAPKLKRATVRLDNVITPGEVLQQAVQSANQQLYKIRTGAGGDRGTTITAALVIGDTCAIANVGDSRTYHYHNGELLQITRDHSLVASLLAAGMIQPEEVRSHPQRNQIFRQLGDKPNVEIDIYSLALAPGDKLVLCCDGLWEMVLDAEIVQILQQAPSPQAACDRLVEAANRAGGDDNISVIVVSLE